MLCSPTNGTETIEPKRLMNTNTMHHHCWVHERFPQVGIVGEDRKFRVLSEQEVKDFLEEAN